MKKLKENNDLSQFFSDIGFISPNNIPDPVTFLTDSDEDSSEHTLDMVSSQATNEYTGWISEFLKHLSLACPRYIEPQKSPLNKDYQVKDLKQTHSFSDTKSENPTLGTGEFPKHEPSQTPPPDYIIDNKPYWLVQKE